MPRPGPAGDSHLQVSTHAGRTAAAAQQLGNVRFESAKTWLHYQEKIRSRLFSVSYRRFMKICPVNTTAQRGTILDPAAAAVRRSPFTHILFHAHTALSNLKLKRRQKPTHSLKVGGTTKRLAVSGFFLEPAPVDERQRRKCHDGKKDHNVKQMRASPFRCCSSPRLCTPSQP